MRLTAPKLFLLSLLALLLGFSFGFYIGRFTTLFPILRPNTGKVITQELIEGKVKEIDGEGQHITILRDESIIIVGVDSGTLFLKTTPRRLSEGIKLFQSSFSRLVEEKRSSFEEINVGDPISALVFELDGALYSSIVYFAQTR